MPIVFRINLGLWTFIALGGIVAAISRFTVLADFWNQMPEVRTQYNLLSGVAFPLFGSIVIYGILLKRYWVIQTINTFNALPIFFAILPLLTPILVDVGEDFVWWDFVQDINWFSEQTVFGIMAIVSYLLQVSGETKQSVRDYIGSELNG